MEESEIGYKRILAIILIFFALILICVCSRSENGEAIKVYSLEQGKSDKLVHTFTWKDKDELVSFTEMLNEMCNSTEEATPSELKISYKLEFMNKDRDGTSNPVNGKLKHTHLRH